MGQHAHFLCARDRVQPPLFPDLVKFLCQTTVTEWATYLMSNMQNMFGGRTDEKSREEFLATTRRNRNSRHTDSRRDDAARVIQVGIALVWES